MADKEESYGFHRDYPAVYSSFHPFPENWWQDRGKYPEDGEDYYGAGIAYWIDKAKDDDPDEMHAAYYARGEINFVEIEQ